MNEVIVNPLTNPLTACPIRVLIVADGGIHYKPQDDGFALTEFVAALGEPLRPWENVLITKALRDQDDEDSCATVSGFKFDNESFNIDRYDQVWLFGRIDESDPTQFLQPNELRCLYDFMNQGGGVFATGDHESLGFALCGNVPRVMSMRKWQFAHAAAEFKAPGRNDDTRIDTLRMGLTAGFQATDQSDSIPQEIRPKFFQNAGLGASFPHPLLGDGEFAITVLPDHMHEGECTLPRDLTRSFKFDGSESFDEYPPWPNSTERSRPDVVAISTSAGGALKELTDIFPPVDPKSFYAIVAYDGHLVEQHDANGAAARLGRVVVDSSFHHFLDLNVIGFKDAEGKPTKDYFAFKKYYRNIVSWLYPPHRKFDYYMSLLLRVRFSGAVMAEAPPKTTFSLEEILDAGSLTRTAIAATLSNGEAIACALAMLAKVSSAVRMEIERLVNPWLPKQLKRQPAVPLLSSDFFLDSILGIAILSISVALPSDIFAAAEQLSPSNLLAEEIALRIAERTELKLGSLLEMVNLSHATLENL